LTASPAELFRENTLINRLLSAFVNQHGYRYLRSILEPLVGETLRVLEDTTLELDPAKLQPGDDLEANSRRVSELAQIFIDRIIASSPRLPSSVLFPLQLYVKLISLLAFLFGVGL
jgi:neurofibromin 1